jgi:phosphoribosylanthranilate isomerase
MLKTKVKVSSVTNLSEARYCAGMGVDFLSFPVSVDPKTYQDITGWVAGPQFGVETENYTEQLNQYSADFIQVSVNAIDQMPDTVKLIVSLPIDLWPGEKAKLIASKDRILFLELVVPALGEREESVIKEAAAEFELFVKSSDNSNLDRMLSLPISGISLEGSAEVKVGLKEYPLAEVLEKLEE